MDSVEQDMRERRDALARAVNARDVEAVAGFLHPDFVARRGRKQFSRDDMIQLFRRVCESAGDFSERVEIEEIQIQGETAELTTRRTEMFSVLIFPCKRRFRNREVWRRLDGQWLLLSEEFVKAAPPGPGKSQ